MGMSIPPGSRDKAVEIYASAAWLVLLNASSSPTMHREKEQRHWEENIRCSSRRLYLGRPCEPSFEAAPIVRCSDIRSPRLLEALSGPHRLPCARRENPGKAGRNRR